MNRENYDTFLDEPESIDFRAILNRYMKYWRWFLSSLLIFLALGLLYASFSNAMYESTAKIKIIDDTKQIDVTADALSMLQSKSNINIDNETEILTSYRILGQVVDELGLDINYFEKGIFKKANIWNPPFTIIKEISEDSLGTPLSYDIQIKTSGISITDEEGLFHNVPFAKLDSSLIDLPFRIRLSQKPNFDGLENTVYTVVLRSKKKTILTLAKNLNVSPTSKDSDVIALSLIDRIPERSEAILNMVIAKYNQDGILDRQQVSRRTIDFIDERFLYLSTELDSVEGGKQNFKQQNDLSYIEADAGISLQRKSETEDDIVALKNQISISSLLKKSITRQAAFELLPVDVGLENSGLNNLADRYNILVLERNKLVRTVSEKHPSLLAINTQLENVKQNIIETLVVYETQLKTSLRQLNREQSKVNNIFSSLPEKEKQLRAIERQQSIKENLFLLLLQKREEAAINLAVTAPSVKVVNYALTNTIPVAPNKKLIVLVSGFLGLALPFTFFYLLFALDGKIREPQDLQLGAPNIPFLAEIPHFEELKLLKDYNERSFLAETFSILATNINYMLPRKNDDLGNVIFVTSSLSGEGKSLCAYNLSVAYTAVNKKVLLVDADLRSPVLHTYFGKGIETRGMTDYLIEPEGQLVDFINPSLIHNSLHHICFSGAIPPNAPQLLSGDGFKRFISEARKQFDIIILDTAPTMPVTDTLLISDLADVTLYLARVGFTEKKMLQEAKELNDRGKLKNMAFVLNGMKRNKFNGYNYRYEKATDKEEVWYSSTIRTGKNFLQTVKKTLGHFQG